MREGFPMGLGREELYAMLYECVARSPGFPSLKAKVLEVVMRRPYVTQQELAAALNLTPGQALIALRSVRLWCHEVETEVRLSRRITPIYRRGAIGGTFDNLHLGHLALLNAAFRSAERVFIGLTTDDFVSSVGKRGVAPYHERREELVRVLERWGWLSRAEIGALSDELGPPAEDPSFDVIIGSPFTLANCLKVNAVRIERGPPPIAVELSPMVLAEDGLPLSSTRIRAGEVDRYGRLTGSRARGGPTA
ncbi:MAG: pantetheine-phosphate adenylyltransferase [Nitrososphaerota archaeon]